MKSRFWLLLLCATMGISHGQTFDARNYTFTTVAGISSVGSSDGQGINARFYRPQGIAVDPTGGLVLADSQNHTLRRVTSSGSVTTLAGTAGIASYSDGAGPVARFNLPSAVVVNNQGVIFMVDANNHSIRRITPDGLVTTFAGDPLMPGHADGVGALARFHRPEGLAIDAHGTLYVADTGNNVIRKITADGTVSTLAGAPGVSGSSDGGPTATRFNTPNCLAIDPQGALYVCDFGNGSLRKVLPDGTTSTLYPRSSGTSVRPTAVAISSSGRIFLSCTDATIRELTSDGAALVLAGAPDQYGSQGGNGTSARFYYPAALAIDANDVLYVADRDDNSVRAVAIASGAVTTVAGRGLDFAYGNVGGSASSARFEDPLGLALGPDRQLYIADTYNHTIRLLDANNNVANVAGSVGENGYRDGAANQALFDHPVGLAVNANRDLFVADRDNYVIRKISATGTVSTLAGSAGQTGTADGTGSQARFTALHGLALDANGNLYVHDASSLRRVTPEGVVTTLNIDLGLSRSYGVAVDASGNLYLSGEHSVRKITPQGAVTTLAGVTSIVTKAAEGYITQAFPGSADGTGANARFNRPLGVAIDSAGTLYVADTDNQTVRRITPDGVVTTLAGLPGATGSADGGTSSARFQAPAAIAADSNGRIYVTSGPTTRLGTSAIFAPQITSQPLSQTVNAGATVTLSVDAAGRAPLSFQWRLGGVAINGATSRTLTLSNIQSAQAGDYTVDVSNPDGAVTSNPATIALNAPPLADPDSRTTGGGGAPSPLFALAVALLVAARRQLERSE